MCEMSNISFKNEREKLERGNIFDFTSFFFQIRICVPIFREKLKFRNNKKKHRGTMWHASRDNIPLNREGINSNVQCNCF